MVRTTDSWFDSFAAYSAFSGVAAAARVWVPGPLTATMNLFAAVHAAAVGASLCGREEASHAVLTPSMLQRHPVPRDCVVTVAGGALTPAAAAGLDTRHYYGAAELSFVAAGSHTEDLMPFPGVDVEIRDGEIWARSPYLARGYLGGDGPMRRDGAWATVGDLGRWAGERLVVLGRAGAVTTAGHTVALAEVEAALRVSTRVEVAAFGLPHDAVGEVLCLAVAGGTEDLAAVKRAAAMLEPGSRPRRWLLLDALPLTPAGKVDRAALVQRCGP